MGYTIRQDKSVIQPFHTKIVWPPVPMAGTIRITASIYVTISTSASTACGGRLVTKDRRYLKSWEQLADPQFLICLVFVWSILSYVIQFLKKNK